MTEHPTDETETDEELAHELDEEATEHNPDETTRREVLELELEEEGRSDLGAEIGDEIP
jgi:hypothetical protein